MRKSELIKIIKEEIANVRKESNQSNFIYSDYHGGSLSELNLGGIVKKVVNSASGTIAVNKMLKKFSVNTYPPATVSGKSLGLGFDYEGKKYFIVVAPLVGVTYTLLDMTNQNNPQILLSGQKSGSSLEQLFLGFMTSHKSKAIAGDEESQKNYQQLVNVTTRVMSKNNPHLKEGWFKNLVVGAGLAASLAGSPSAQAATGGGKIPKIEYLSNIPKSRQNEVGEAFRDFLKRCQKENGSTDQSKKVKDALMSKSYDVIIREFLAASDENDLVGTTTAESEFLKNNFVAIATSIK